MGHHEGDTLPPVQKTGYARHKTSGNRSFLSRSNSRPSHPRDPRASERAAVTARAEGVKAVETVGF